MAAAREDRGRKASGIEERLQKVISGAGCCSRRKAERLMAEGRVTVDGRKATEPGLKVDPARAVILVDGRPLGPPEKLIYYMFHKPSGCLTTLDDPRGRPTINPFLAGLPARVFPVGPLDMDVEGLLILTNDGPLARRLMHPSSKVPKVYRVKVEGLPDEEDLARLRNGVLPLGGRPAAPAGAELLKTAREGTAGARAWLSLTLTEGRRRQVKRMCS
ncbi:MAG: rRNA pseudouridine synthase, partial [Candidatus Adiutrix sp.]|nr:rRNA pseudouridine synthase [Candidatus Adiutrix sp.]